MTFCEQIKTKYDLISLYKNLGLQFEKTDSKSGMALCPFHDDTKPSLIVYSNTGVFKCFSCGKQGDVINFAAISWALDPKINFTEIKSRILDIIKEVKNEY